MIGYLKGDVIKKFPDGSSIILNVNGVGYRLELPMSVFCDVTLNQAHVELYILTHVREDAIRLFGFKSDSDLSMFESFLSVSGIGPKVALALLGSFSSHELCDVILSEDLARLTSVPGVGGKTGERIILEMK